MANKTRIKLRGDTTANWSSNNPTLAAREIGFDTTTKRFKLGDGSTAWNSLKYVLQGINDTATSDKLTITDSYIKTAGNLFINETSNANMTTGLTINQGGADDEILAFKSSDIAHGMTSLAETDTFLTIKKANSASGGGFLQSYSSAALSLALYGTATTEDSTSTASSLSNIYLRAGLKSGTTYNVHASGANIVSFANYSNTTHLFKGDGSQAWILPNQGYLFTQGSGQSSLDIQSLTAGRYHNIRLFTNDGDGTDNIGLYVYGVGGPSSLTDTERMQIGWDGTNNYILSYATGTGTVRPLSIATGSNSNQLYLGTGGAVFIGDSANANNTKGLTINQGASDDEAFSLKSSDVAHGLTSISETDTYCSIGKNSGTGGGIRLDVITDGDETSSICGYYSHYLRDTADTTASTAGRGVIEFNAAQHDGANSISAVAAAGNIFVMRNNDTAEHIFRGDGDIYTNTDQTAGLAGTFDDQDDLALVDALRYAVKGYKPNNLTKQRKKLQELGIMEGTFLSDRGFKDLTLGSFGQMYKGLIFLAKQLGATEEQLKQAMTGV